MLRGHSVHRVVYFLKGTCAGFYVKERELCHQSLVLAVESHLGGIRRHIPSGVNAKFIAAYGLAVNYAGIVGDGNVRDLSGEVVLQKETVFILEHGESALSFGGELRVFVTGDTAVANTLVDGLLHSEVLARMGLTDIQDPVLSKKCAAR